MTTAEYIQMRAFARYDGLSLAMVWTASFILYIAGMSTSLLMMVGVVMGVMSPVIIMSKLNHFRDDVLDGVIGFGRAYGYSILTFFYAALLLAVAQLAYFQFFDKGFILSHIGEMLSDEQMRAALRQSGMEQTFNEAASAFSSMRPIDIAINYLTLNVALGVVVCLPIAYSARTMTAKKRPQKRNDNGHISNSASV